MVQTKKLKKNMDNATTDMILNHRDVVIPPPKAPWYRKVAKSIRTTPTLYIVGMTVFLAASIFYANIKRQPSDETLAGSNQAVMSIQPSSLTLPDSNGILQLWINADNPVGYVRTDLTYDPNLMQLAQDVQLKDLSLTKIIKVTPQTEANATGTITIVVALDPAHPQNPPLGALHIATLTFAKNTNSSNTITSLNLEKPQIVNADGTLFTVTTQGATVIINPPSPTATPTTIPTSTPRPLPTPTTPAGATPLPPTATPLPPTPTSTVPSPTPTPMDVSGPIVIIFSPTDGQDVSGISRFTVSTSATDLTGISLIQILIDNKVIKTCTGTTSCRTSYATRYLDTGEHQVTVEATDSSPQRNVGSKSISISYTKSSIIKIFNPRKPGK